MKKERGLFVRTKSGEKGFTKWSDGLINSKQPVYLLKGGQVLCDPATLVTIGFKD